MGRVNVMGDADEERSGALRIDRWLFAVRLAKTRSAAADAVTGGKVQLNGARIKPAHAVKPGDRVSLGRGGVMFECVVNAIPARRGPASEASLCYEETAASVARREEFAARMSVAAQLATDSDTRPNKRERRQLRQLRGRN